MTKKDAISIDDLTSNFQKDAGFKKEIGPYTIKVRLSPFDHDTGEFIWEVESKDMRQFPIYPDDRFPRLYFNLLALQMEINSWLRAKGILEA